MTGKIRPINAGSKVEKELDHENLETKDLKEEYLKELMLGTEDNKDKEK